VASLGLSSFGEGVLIDHTAQLLAPERIEIGSHVRIDAFTVISAGVGGIEIGDYVHVGALSFVAGADRIRLEDFSGLSIRTTVLSSDEDYTGGAMTNPTVPDELRNVHSAPVTIEEHAIVGAGSLVLPGATLGMGCAVGALSVVKRDVPPRAVVVGPKATVVGERRDGFLELSDRLKRSAR
jgi:galactoside O-acetyltransferase